MKKKYLLFVIIAIGISIALSFQLTQNKNQENEIILEKESENIIYWNENRPLTWDDFTGEIYLKDDPNASAQTSTSINYRHAVLVFTEGICQYYLDYIRAEGIVHKDKSWVIEKAKSDYLLNHEQGHFNIAEIFARKFKQRALNEFYHVLFPCPSNNSMNNISDIALEEMGQRLDLSYERAHAEMSLMQEIYDNDTLHSRDEEKQYKWNQKIANCLKMNLNEIENCELYS